MRSFRAGGELLRLRDIVDRTGLHKATSCRRARLVSEARIPFIAVDMPHPGAVFFGPRQLPVGTARWTRWFCWELRLPEPLALPE